MALHFSRDEYFQRQDAARESIRADSLDALVIFSQESHYYLTGFDTSGYVWFQAAILTADAQPYTLLTRMPDVQNARITSVIDDIRVWRDDGINDPALHLRDVMRERGLEGGRVGIEMSTHGLTGANYEKVRLALDGFCRLEDASMLVRRLRVRKSPAEIAYVRKAAEIADEALEAMIAEVRPGAFEGDVAAAGVGTILRRGGDVAPSGPTVGSGPRALSGRASTGPVHLAGVDQITLEFAAPFRRYNACLMRTLPVGAAIDRQKAMYDAVLEALHRATEAARPGRRLGDVYLEHQSVLDRAGLGKYRRPSCGYSLGATYRPTWMDAPPMLFPTLEMPAEQGMTLFIHSVCMDDDHGLAMSVGHTILITGTGSEVLSRLTPSFDIRR